MCAAETAGGQPLVNKWLITLAVMIPTLIEILDTSVANVALNHIQGSLSAGQEEVTWVLTSYLVANAVVIPETMPYAEATNFPTLYPTAYGVLKWKANLQPGEVMLVHGAGGGSGLTGIEVGKAMGATVIASAGGADKLAAAREAGADHLIDYRKEDLRAKVLELTGGRGADVVYDPVGGSAFDISLRCIAPEGRLIPMGFASGTIPQIPANILLVKNATVIGMAVLVP